MEPEKLIRQVIGGDEPPLQINFAELEAAAARSVKRRQVIFSAAAVSGVIGIATCAGLLFTHQADDTSIAPAAPPSATSSPPNPLRPTIPTNRTMAYCYQSADITSDAPNQHVLIGVSGSDIDGRGDVSVRALAICAQAWTNNYYDWIPDKSSGTQPPPLTACILDRRAVDAQEGVVGVFPGDSSTCADLGLPQATI